MSECKHGNVKIYDGKHRCMQCFETFVHIDKLDGLKQSIAELILEEFNDYAPDEPPVQIGEFIEALKEVVNDI